MPYSIDLGKLIYYKLLIIGNAGREHLEQEISITGNMISFYDLSCILDRFGKLLDLKMGMVIQLYLYEHGDMQP